MTFASELDKPASYRHTLVRLTPARYVGDDLVSEGSGIYGMTFHYPIARIERNGTALTEDAAAPTVNDHWYHDESTGDLDIKLSGAPSGSNNIIVIFYYLLYTSTEDTVAHETPTDSATAMRQWEPRLLGEPSFNQSLSDVFFGVFTVQPSSLALNNADAAFQAYLTRYDSFYNKAVDCWIDVNGEVAKVFSGVVVDLSVSDTVSLTVHDAFEKLTQPAFMGDDFDEVFYLTSTYAGMGEEHHLKPCRYVVGHSKHRLKSSLDDGFGRDSEVGGGGTNTNLLGFPDWSGCSHAVPTFAIEKDPASPGTANRGPWAL